MYIEEEVKNLRKELTELKEETKSLAMQISSKQSENLITVEQASKILGIGKQGVLYHIRKGNLKATGLRYKKLSEQEVLTFKNKQSN